MGFFENVSKKIKNGKDEHDIAYAEAAERARWMSDEKLMKEIRGYASPTSWKAMGTFKAYRDEYKRRHE